MRRLFKRFILFCFSIVVSFCILLGVVVYFYSTPRGGPIEYQLIKIERGQSFYSIARELESKNIIKSRRTFYYLARLQNKIPDVKSGDYLLSTSMSSQDILSIITGGRVHLLDITVLEGMRYRDIGLLLEKRYFFPADLFHEAATDIPFLRELDIAGTSAEGYLYPETYRFARGLNPREIINVMHAELLKHITPEMEVQRKKLGWSFHQVLTLASIIETETNYIPEMPLISSVFHNRLKRRMRLQSDPTVIYGLQDFNGNITRVHLQTSHPYNTYRNAGLPPGPIANPRIEAIQAALFPDKSPYLYFVSRNDGTHHFSATLTEHNSAVDKYQRHGS